MKNKCLKIKKGLFGRPREYYKHTWEYIDREHRICSVCGKRELLYRLDYLNGHRYEDWRQLYNK